MSERIFSDIPEMYRLPPGTPKIADMYFRRDFRVSEMLASDTDRWTTPIVAIGYSCPKKQENKPRRLKFGRPT